jgi:hypothetical protein
MEQYPDNSSKIVFIGMTYGIPGIYSMGPIDLGIHPRGWFDNGIAYELEYWRFEVTKKKAQYLSQMGHSKDAIRIYESLLQQAFLREDEKERLRKTI